VRAREGEYLRSSSSSPKSAPVLLSCFKYAFAA
jgi:hypothetical protein